MPTRYDAVIFDLLTGLLDSWSLWNAVAGDAETGHRWRHHYLKLTYATGDYQPYEELVVQAAEEQGLGIETGRQLVARWDELQPWPEAPDVLRRLKGEVPLAVVTNCSVALGTKAIDKVGVPFDVVVIAEQVGAYKPDPRPYRAALDQLDVVPQRALFVAGSAFDVNGAGRVGTPVFWHNHAGLPRPDEGLQTLEAEHCSLDPLVEFVFGGVNPASRRLWGS
ncbi:MAG: HAD-IA family hydrolase [Hyphomicrobiaceae bacterium]|nr:HAD-IA family hydrolase [Hyphomicrobiaceae bacterium]